MRGQSLTIVMYHYVRPFARTRFPEIKGLELASFREQIGYLQRHYTLISGQQLIAAVNTRSDEGWDLPRDAALLTFDDGYIDHYDYVFPILDDARISACFFPPSCAVLERSLLDVNYIHFVLASVKDKRRLVDDIFKRLDHYRTEFSLKSNDEYFEELAKPSRMDPKEVIFIKRILQRALPTDLRAILCRELFGAYVSADERAFAEELYVSVDQLKVMARSGMYIGCHGHRHSWLGQLNVNEQAEDIGMSLKMLADIGTDTDAWIMCYPYGNSNASLRHMIQERGGAVGLSTEVGIATVQGNPLSMPRLDTNDLPADSAAAPNSWTVKAKQLIQ